MADDSLASATFAGGCFWCVEAAFDELAGVESTTSGYTGGHVDDPAYEAVCSGETGHAEAVQVEYDPARLGYEDLLAVFFAVHDPTTLNRQGPDVGSQYRSAIFTHDDDQREAAEAFIDALEADGVYDDPVVTEVEPLETFWVAEDYHQDYYRKSQTGTGNTNNAYCQIHVAPKVRKVREQFSERVASTE